MANGPNIFQMLLVFYLHTLGDDFPNAASLLETVLELQAERERAPVSTQDIRSSSSSTSSAVSVPEGQYAFRLNCSRSRILIRLAVKHLAVGMLLIFRQFVFMPMITDDSVRSILIHLVGS